MHRKSDNREDYQEIARPLGAMAKDFPPGHRVEPHSHVRAQLLYAVAGVMEITTTRGVWVASPQRGVWLPAGTLHSMRTRGGASVRTFYVRPDACPESFPAGPSLVRVTPLLRELILSAIAMPLDYDEAGRDGLVVRLLLQAIEWSAEAPILLQEPKDTRLLRLHHALVENPADPATLEEWGKRVGASTRTLARLVQAEYGIPFTRWRQQLRILAALPRLAAGEAVTLVALDLGYESPGAFSSMFARLLGVPPSRYLVASDQA